MADRDKTHRVPVEQVLPGYTIEPLVDDHEALYAYLLIKTRAKDGTTGWSFRSPDEDYNPEELLGALISQADWLRHRMLGEWDD